MSVLLDIARSISVAALLPATLAATYGLILLAGWTIAMLPVYGTLVVGVVACLLLVILIGMTEA